METEDLFHLGSSRSEDETTSEASLALQSLQKAYNKRIAALKERNALEESTFKTQCESDLRDVFWEISMRCLGKVDLTQPLPELLDSAFDAETFEMEQKLITLSQTLDTEYNQAKRSTQKRRAPTRTSATLARDIFGLMELNRSNDTTSELIDIVRSEREWIESLPVSKRKHKSQSPSPPPLPPEIPKKNDRIDLVGHVRERERLKDAIRKTDHFVRKMSRPS